MVTMTALLVICAGLLVRLAFPIIVTSVLVYFLHQLDARWQAGAELRSVSVPKPECWKIRGFSPEQRKDCIAFSSPLPCWQVFRLPNGYLQEECLSCEVFINAPIPTLKAELRRM